MSLATAVLAVVVTLQNSQHSMSDIQDQFVHLMTGRKETMLTRRVTVWKDVKS